MKPLILLSGWGTTSDSLADLSKGLEPAADVTNLSVHDLQRDSGAGVKSYAEQLGEQVRQGKEPTVLVGWSMGGMIALEVTAQAPEHVSHLVLISSTPRFCSDKTFPYGLPVAQLRGLAQQLAAAPVPSLHGFFEATAQPNTFTENEIELRIARATSWNAESLQHGLTYLQESDLREVLPALQTPTLVLHGQDDLIIPSAAGHFMADTVPHGTFQPRANCGHDLPTRFPAEVTDIINSFLTS